MKPNLHDEYAEFKAIWNGFCQEHLAGQDPLEDGYTFDDLMAKSPLVREAWGLYTQRLFNDHRI